MLDDDFAHYTSPARKRKAILASKNLEAQGNVMMKRANKANGAHMQFKVGDIVQVNISENDQNKLTPNVHTQY